MIPPLQSVSYAFRLQSDLRQVDPVRRSVLQILRDAGLPESELEGWKLTFTEAVCNAILHGNRQDPDKTVEVRLEILGKEVVLRVRDAGPGPPQEKARSPQLPKDPFDESGRGLFLITDFADKVEHWHGDEGYLTRIIRRHDSLPDLAEPEPEMDRLVQELSESYENLAAFHKLGPLLLDSASPADFLRDYLEDLVSSGLIAEYLLLATPAIHPDTSESLKTLPAYVPPEAAQLHEEAAAQCEHQVWDEPAQFPPPLAALLREKQFQHGCCLPIKVDGATRALLCARLTPTLMTARSAVLNNLGTICEIFGIEFARHRLRLMRDRQMQDLRELELATNIQNRLLPVPQPVCTKGWSVWMNRASAGQVSGDFVEVLEDPQDHLVVSMIDVMGKGVTAALLALVYRSALAVALRNTADLAEVLRQVNHELCRQLNDLTMFVTCTLVKLRRDSREGELISAGHCPTLLLTGNAATPDAVETREWEASGPPLGLFADAQYQVQHWQCPAFARLNLLTDGAYEWKFNGDLYGWERFREYLREQYPAHPAELWATLLELVGTNAPPADDITLAIIESRL